MSQDNTLVTPKVNLMAIDAIFKRIAERGRKVRTQAKENFSSARQITSNTDQTIDDEKKVVKVQGSK